MSLPDAASSWFLLKEDSDPYLSVFIQCGERARAALSGRPQGRTLWEAAPRSIRSALCRACAKAIESQVPWRLEGTYETSEGADVRYRSIFLPIDGGGRHPGYVLGAFTSKRFANGSGYAGQ